MATTTTNMGLKKPALSDDALISDINDNMDLIDTAAEATSEGIAFVSIGNTHAAISQGKYVYIRRHSTLAEGLYTANSSLAANATLTSSNVTAVPSGGALNALNDQIVSLEKNSSTTSAEVNLNSYDSSSNEYIFPYDGYIVLDGGSGSNGYIRCVVRSQNGECKPYMYMNVTSSYQIQSLFVKKGMKVYVSANTVTGGNVKYYPLNNKQ